MNNFVANRLQARRRSVRLALNILVRLDGHDRQKCIFTLLPARATGLNRHGAAIQVGRELIIGSILSVRHGRGDLRTSARVVAQVGGAAEGIFTYGIEFLDGDGTKTFWGIAFPSIEGKGIPAQRAEHAGIVRRKPAIPFRQIDSIP